MSIKVSVVIPNYNGKDYLDKCISSLLFQDFRWFEIIVVDDCSQDQAFEECKNKYAGNKIVPVKFIKRKINGGFCACVNDGIVNADGQYVLLLNNDTEADKSMVGNLYKAICNNNRVFSVGAKMIQLHNKELLDDTGDLYCLLGWAFSPAKDKPVSKYTRKAKVFACCGGCAIYRRDLLLKLGLFDDNHFAYLEDIDIGYRAKLHGYINMYEPSAVVYHAGSATSGSRHNDFKVRLAAKNSIYLIFKNMAYWQLLINWPMIVLGILIKLVYFTRKHLGISYLQGLRQGFALCHSRKGIQRRVAFKRIPLLRVIGIECELIINTFRRFLG
ncbi:MAG: glycosyltransferase family 2 protein [Lachnospiraceae bacterium]|nr:glycosyltransferase family 2 protein [Lachnospiraceae bacterium]